MTWLDYLVLLLYFTTMVAIGLWAMRRIHNKEDYFLGGRSFGKLMQTFAAFGAGTGAHEPIAVGRTTWTSGLSGVWTALLWLFVTPFYWIASVWYRRMRHLTLGDWYVERYESQAMGAAYTIFGLVFYMFYLSTMFSAISKIAAPLIGIDSVSLPGLAEPVSLEYVLVPIVAVLVIAYGVLGGLTAAYWTDLIQGLFIIFLSVILIPLGLSTLVERFGDPATEGMLDGMRILHERIPASYFSLFSGPASGEFPPQYILSLTLLALVGIVVQPHFIATGGGSAKSENAARVGLVFGNFLKRLCSVGWALTALIALALLANNLTVVEDPDRVWGIAAREILGPLNLGLVGLMLACLLAALMSSADTSMLVGSALVVRNVYVPYIDPQASEKTYVRVGRVAGLLIIAGAASVSLTLMNVFRQFQLALEIPIVFAAPFWIGLYWRRGTQAAAWGTILFSLILFFVLPAALPSALPNLRTNPDYLITTERIESTTERPATATDVALRQAERELWQRDQSTTKPEPQPLEQGQMMKIVQTRGGQVIFWRDGIRDGVGQGTFQLDFVLYQWLGLDLSRVSKGTLESLRLPMRLVTPFLVMICLSWLTRRGSQQALDRYYAKMKTPVAPDPAEDVRRLQHAYDHPGDTIQQPLFPGTNFEFCRPTPTDLIGFFASVAVCGLILAFTSWLAGIGG